MPGWELIGSEERYAVLDVFEPTSMPSPQAHLFTNKRKVREFEQAFAESLETSDAVAVSSGTAALKVALKSLDLRAGDEVITQAHTFVATVEAIVDCGAVPVIAEIDESLNMDPADLQKKITRRTKVILPVHMMGVGCQMDAIMYEADCFKCRVVEDTAQACHGTYHGQKLGLIGDLGAFSFSYSKILTTGEGGMVVARANTHLLACARSYSDHGHDNDPQVPSRGQDTHARGGFNYRMGAFQAAVGLAQLKKLPESIQRHRQNKASLLKCLLDLYPSLHRRKIADPAGDMGDAVCFFLATERAAHRVARRLFEKEGVLLKNLPDALNWHSAENWSHLLGQKAALLTHSGALLRRAIAIQVSYNWTHADIQRIAAVTHAAIQEAL